MNLIRIGKTWSSGGFFLLIYILVKANNLNDITLESLKPPLSLTASVTMMMSDIPNDLIEEILCRVPATYLGRS